MILHGNCLERMKEMESNSVDSIVTDPPYGLSFMGKKWDYDVPSVEIWKEALRVLKPGGHLLSFGGTRTYHRMVVNIEDAGFEIRDQIQWLYGSGFPKSQNVSKEIDKQAGVEPLQGDKNPAFRARQLEHNTDWETAMRPEFKTKPNSEAAKKWQGWGTALKPANEPIVVARKPIEKSLTIAENVQKWGTGAINIDGSRIGTEKIESGRSGRSGQTGFCTPKQSTDNKKFSTGRWPANVLFDEEAAAVLDEQSGITKSGSLKGDEPSSRTSNVFGEFESRSLTTHGDSGGASRFFYVAKASKRERNSGLEGMPEKSSGIKNDSGRGFSEGDPYKEVKNQNHHPTVKPVKLMEYLVRMITPPGGTCIDPFMGSGTTGVACKNLGFDFIGIEMNEEYIEIAKKRIG